MNDSSSSRRSFIRKLALLAGGATVSPVLRDHADAAGPTPTDEMICKHKFTLAAKEELHKRPMGEVMIAVGVSFLGTPYVAGTLEQPGAEHLVVNLQGLDCVTFVENTLALSRCIKLGARTFDAFRKQLQLIRYRDGAIDGYPSRLHYFSDWIDENSRRGIVQNISQELGGVREARAISFMSEHVASYKHLGETAILAKIKEIESALSSRPRFYIPKDVVRSVEARIEPGDIIGITTATPGLDIVHTGMAIRTNGVLKYLHAPLSKGKVQITEHSLADYLAGYERHTGIMVARPLEPKQ
jgi:hypothetical protein